MSNKKSEKTKTIQQKIREMRAVLGLSAKKLGEKTGFSLTAIQYYERDREPSYKFLKACVEKFGVRPQYFLEENDAVIFKKDEEADPEIVKAVQDVGTELEYLKNEVAELKEWKKRQDST